LLTYFQKTPGNTGLMW